MTTEREIIRALTRVSRKLDTLRPWTPEWLKTRREERELRFRLQNVHFDSFKS